jgi:hypothetical protein
LIDNLKKNAHVLSFQLGAGFDIARLTLDVSYEWGATELYQLQDLKTKNKVLNLSIGFKFF